MKKNNYLFLLLLMATSLVMAQTEKGNYILSGSTNLQYINSNSEFEHNGQVLRDENVSSFSFAPSIGYFVMDNLAVGLALNFTSTTQKDDEYESTESSILIIPTAQYYFTTSIKELRPFAQLGVGYASYKNPQGFENEYSGITFNFGGGIAYFVNSNVSLNFGLSYTISKISSNTGLQLSLNQGSFGTNLGISVYF